MPGNKVLDGGGIAPTPRRMKETAKGCALWPQGAIVRLAMTFLIFLPGAAITRVVAAQLLNIDGNSRDVRSFEHGLLLPIRLRLGAFAAGRRLLGVMSPGQRRRGRQARGLNLENILDALL